MRFHVIDVRTGQPASIATYGTREQAERKIAEWQCRDAKGGRPDIHDVLPFLAVSDMIATCPYCGADLQGGPTMSQRTIGVEIPSVYDGILYWRCPDCRGAWPRFTGDDVRAALSARYATESNEKDGR